MSDFTNSYDVLLEMIVDGIEAGSVDGLTPEEVVCNIESAIASHRAFHGDAPEARPPVDLPLDQVWICFVKGDDKGPRIRAWTTEKARAERFRYDNVNVMEYVRRAPAVEGCCCPFDGCYPCPACIAASERPTMADFDAIEWDDNGDHPQTWKGLALAAIADLRSYAHDEAPERRIVSAEGYEADAVRLERLPPLHSAASTAELRDTLKPFADMADAMYVSGHCGGASPEDWPDKWSTSTTGGKDHHMPQVQGWERCVMKNGYRKTRLGLLHYRKAKKLWTLRSDGRSGPQVSRGYARHVRRMKATSYARKDRNSAS